MRHHLMCTRRSGYIDKGSVEPLLAKSNFTWETLISQIEHLKAVVTVT